MKQCIYCGELKDERQFRPYYNRPNGRYTFCRSCEKIEARRKYLSRKQELSVDEQVELTAINELYATRRKVGLQAPGQGRLKPAVSTLDIVNAELQKLNSAK